MNTYFIHNNEILCFDCGCDADCTNEQKNETGETLTCSCGQDIPSAGQQQTVRYISKDFWN